jgi:hypothetical protein
MEHQAVSGVSISDDHQGHGYAIGLQVSAELGEADEGREQFTGRF